MSVTSLLARLALAVSTSAMCAACAGLPGEPPISRDIPPASAVIARAGAIPAVRAGDDARIALARSTASLRACNAALQSSAIRYERIRAMLRAGKAS